jgi:hypothetical protein
LNLDDNNSSDGEDANVDVDDDAESNPATNSQPSVQMIKAVTGAWRTGALVFAYIMIWLIYFAEGVLSAATGTLAPYIISAFATHSLTPTVGILSSVVGGVTNLALVKALDVFGRPHCRLFCILLAIVGLITMTACSSVQVYAVGQVSQSVGSNGIQYSLTVFVADTTSLRSRGLIQAIVTSSNLIRCWLAGPISAKFLDGPG